VVVGDLPGTSAGGENIASDDFTTVLDHSVHFNIKLNS